MNSDEIVDTVNLAQRVAIMRDGSQRPITNMFDCDGEETDDPGECRAFVVKQADDFWIIDYRENFEIVRRN